MFKGINGNFNNGVNPNLFVKRDVNAEEAKEVKPEVPVGKPETKEVGDDLLDPRLFTNALGFVRQTGTVGKEDKKDIEALYALAGMGTVPTAEQYKSIAAATQTFAGGMDKLTTTNNAERFFNTAQFQKLNEEFGIV